MNATVDVARTRREDIRWQIVLTLNNARPLGRSRSWRWPWCGPSTRMPAARSCGANSITSRARELVKIRRQPDNRWHADLSRNGIDLAEYTIDCEPARPARQILVRPVPRRKLVDLLPQELRTELDRLIQQQASATTSPSLIGSRNAVTPSNRR